MPAYVDDAAIPYKGKPRFHLTADSLEELHGFCGQVGINRCWFHRGSRHPHYDITGDQREATLRAGALPVTSKELMTRAKRLAPARRLAADLGQPQ